MRSTSYAGTCASKWVHWTAKWWTTMNRSLGLVFMITLSNTASASPGSLPEFECRAIKLESSSARDVLGAADYPSIALRRSMSGRWLLRVKAQEEDLPADRIAKTTMAIGNKVVYVIHFDKRVLRVELQGKPPSRSGHLWAERNPQEDSAVAKLTCH